MKKHIIKKAAFSLLAVSAGITLAACDKGGATTTTDGGQTGTTTTNGGSSEKYNNETTPLVIATQTPDGVFNPFFATSAYDQEVVGQTQIGMISTDDNGSVKVGEDEPCVVLDYNIQTTDTRTDKTDKEDYDNYYTTYQFVIKNDLKFSDGSALTIDDVLFNLYVYLDPTYTGSSTIYSTNIKGLKAYRAQSTDSGEAESADTYFSTEAAKRIEAILAWCNSSDTDAATGQVAEDIEMMKPLFKDELESDWNTAASSLSSYEDTYKFSAAWQLFLYNYGKITLKTQSDDTWDKDKMGTECPEALNWNGWDERGPENGGDGNKDYFINAIYSDMVENSNIKTLKSNIKSVISYYATATTFKSALIAEIKSDYYEKIKEEGGLVVKNISGITTSTSDSFTNINGNTVKYDSEHSILQIVVNGVDPKAIWNFSFTVTPMKYYSTAEEIAKVEEDKATYGANSSERSHFGVDFSSKDFMDTLSSKLVPVGAGTYQVCKSNGDSIDPTTGKVAEFFTNNVVYYKRNDYFYKNVNIKYLRYKVVSTTQLYNAVLTGEVDYADPSAKAETVSEINSKYSDTIGYSLVDNLGYGYIGINANYIKAIEVRRAIMYAMDTSLVLNYYTNEMASVIYRPMSKVSWAYPEGAESYYKYVGDMFESEQDQIDFIEELVESAGYTKNKSGIYHRTDPVSGKDDILKITFSLAGETTDHPAYNTFANAKTILNKCGFDITVTTDPNALSKLSSGTLSVWAAAWGSTIDPDMYQVYHKESTATSVNNWGYPYLLDHGTDEELEIIDELSELIDEGRETTVQSERKDIYSQALDKVMDLAVELPTYQRKNLFVYNKAKIKASSLCQNVTPYNGPLSRIWEVSFNQ